ncbi:hypothetical protein SGRA_1868 [Saprospira grandis str. Lewin]|uniref:Uncharacterized protein n=1 Tax=Saprospira grandis (strain Lewin) TaxID=984262 RepID=H6L0R6_SAPGL|nr:hypothetical protein SGRA_1868 [Saprospira grandis str. Lewin]
MGLKKGAKLRFCAFFSGQGRISSYLGRYFLRYAGAKRRRPSAAEGWRTAPDQGGKAAAGPNRPVSPAA